MHECRPEAERLAAGAPRVAGAPAALSSPRTMIAAGLRTLRVVSRARDSQLADVRPRRAGLVCCHDSDPNPQSGFIAASSPGDFVHRMPEHWEPDVRQLPSTGCRPKVPLRLWWRAAGRKEALTFVSETNPTRPRVFPASNTSTSEPADRA